MKKILFGLLIISFTISGLAQNLHLPESWYQNVIYDNLYEDHPQVLVPPYTYNTEENLGGGGSGEGEEEEEGGDASGEDGESNVFGQQESIYSISDRGVQYVYLQVPLSLNKTYLIEDIRFLYTLYGNWYESGLGKLTITAFNITTGWQTTWEESNNNLFHKSGASVELYHFHFQSWQHDKYVLPKGEYRISILLESVNYDNNQNYNSNGQIKPNRYAASLINEDHTYPVEIFGYPLCPELDVQLCSASQNFALGYDESAAITINNVENAEGELSYVWSNEETTAGISVAPTETTTYSVTVTDANGCTGSAEHEVVVYDVAYSKPEKEGKEKDAKDLAKEAEKAAKDLEKGHNEVIMTHKGDHEHKVKAKDVAKKLNDKKGEWTLGTLLMQEIDFSGGDCADEDRYKTDLQDEGVFDLEYEFTLNAYPNPVRNTLTLESETKLNGIVMVYDLYGALLDERIAHDVWELNLDFTHLRKGFYTVVYENNEGLTTAKRILKD